MNRMQRGYSVSWERSRALDNDLDINKWIRMAPVSQCRSVAGVSYGVDRRWPTWAWRPPRRVGQSSDALDNAPTRPYTPLLFFYGQLSRTSHSFEYHVDVCADPEARGGVAVRQEARHNFSRVEGHSCRFHRRGGRSYPREAWFDEFAAPRSYWRPCVA